MAVPCASAGGGRRPPEGEEKGRREGIRGGRQRAREPERERRASEERERSGANELGLPMGVRAPLASLIYAPPPTVGSNGRMERGRRIRRLIAV